MTTLNSGYELDGYRIERVLGAGGFGITYKAVDFKDCLKSAVAIKEYFPRQIAVRERDRVRVTVREQRDGEDFSRGLQQFVREAKTLRAFRHPAIVKVLRLLEANGSAYMVMEYESGMTLEKWLADHPEPSEQQLKDIFIHILHGLQYVHDHNYLHRDIKPPNIYLRRQGGAMLLDFGSARQGLGKFTTLVSPGFAPYEQYEGREQGPWSDIYGLGATLYYCIDGCRVPADINMRVGGLYQNKVDPLVAAVAVGKGRYSERFLSSIDRMLHTEPAQRTQSVREILYEWNTQVIAMDGSPTIHPQAMLVDEQQTWTAVSREVIAHSREGKRPLELETAEPPYTRTLNRGNLAWTTGMVVLVLVAVIMVWQLVRPIAPLSGEIDEEAAVPVDIKTQPNAAVEPAADSTAEGVAHPDHGLPVDATPATIEIRLRIESRPAGASVFVDGKRFGSTPFDMSLPAGGESVTLKVSKPGYQPWHRHLDGGQSGPYVFKPVLTPLQSTTKPPTKPAVRRPGRSNTVELVAGAPLRQFSRDPQVNAIYRRAYHGDAAAQFSIGQHYEFGRGLPRNFDMAAIWYAKAARQGDAKAQNSLGFMYDQGYGVPRDYEKAVSWYLKSASKGNASAQTNLAMMYEKGQGTIRDYHAAMRWYQKAARQGNLRAQNAIGMMYIKGRGVRSDYKKAHRWLLVAAKRNHATAQNNVASMYEYGKGVRRNYSKALRWYQKAADQGLASAQYNLARMYEQGKGVKRDVSMAINWYRMAAKKGHDKSVWQLRKLGVLTEGFVR